MSGNPMTLVGLRGATTCPENIVVAFQRAV